MHIYPSSPLHTFPLIEATAKMPRMDPGSELYYIVTQTAHVAGYHFAICFKNPNSGRLCWHSAANITPSVRVCGDKPLRAESIGEGIAKSDGTRLASMRIIATLMLQALVYNPSGCYVYASILNETSKQGGSSKHGYQAAHVIPVAAVGLIAPKNQPLIEALPVFQDLIRGYLLYLEKECEEEDEKKLACVRSNFPDVGLLRPLFSEGATADFDEAIGKLKDAGTILEFIGGIKGILLALKDGNLNIAAAGEPVNHLEGTCFENWLNSVNELPGLFNQGDIVFETLYREPCIAGLQYATMSQQTLLHLCSQAIQLQYDAMFQADQTFCYLGEEAVILASDGALDQITEVQQKIEELFLFFSSNANSDPHIVKVKIGALLDALKTYLVVSSRCINRVSKLEAAPKIDKNKKDPSEVWTEFERRRAPASAQPPSFPSVKKILPNFPEVEAQFTAKSDTFENFCSSLSKALRQSSQKRRKQVKDDSVQESFLQEFARTLEGQADSRPIFEIYFPNLFRHDLSPEDKTFNILLVKLKEHSRGFHQKKIATELLQGELSPQVIAQKWSQLQPGDLQGARDLLHCLVQQSILTDVCEEAVASVDVSTILQRVLNDTLLNITEPYPDGLRLLIEALKYKTALMIGQQCESRWNFPEEWQGAATIPDWIESSRAAQAPPVKYEPLDDLLKSSSDGTKVDTLKIIQTFYDERKGEIPREVREPIEQKLFASRFHNFQRVNKGKIFQPMSSDDLRSRLQAFIDEELSNGNHSNERFLHSLQARETLRCQIAAALKPSFGQIELAFEGDIQRSLKTMVDGLNNFDLFLEFSNFCPATLGSQLKNKSSTKVLVPLPQKMEIEHSRLVLLELLISCGGDGIVSALEKAMNRHCQALENVQEPGLIKNEAGAGATFKLIPGQMEALRVFSAAPLLGISQRLLTDPPALESLMRSILATEFPRLFPDDPWTNTDLNHHPLEILVPLVRLGIFSRKEGLLESCRGNSAAIPGDLWRWKSEDNGPTDFHYSISLENLKPISNSANPQITDAGDFSVRFSPIPTVANDGPHGPRVAQSIAQDVIPPILQMWQQEKFSKSPTIIIEGRAFFIPVELMTADGIAIRPVPSSLSPPVPSGELSPDSDESD